MRSIQVGNLHTALQLPMNKKWFIFLFIMTGWVWSTTAQSIYVYHTPSGKKYHTVTCHMVDNTSNSITIEEARKKGLTPCTFCKPDDQIESGKLQPAYPMPQPGQKEVASQCLGKTKEGLRCKRMTRNANGYCFQHLPPEKT